MSKYTDAHHARYRRRMVELFADAKAPEVFKAPPARAQFDFVKQIAARVARFERKWSRDYDPPRHIVEWAERVNVAKRRRAKQHHQLIGGSVAYPQPVDK